MKLKSLLLASAVVLAAPVAASAQDVDMSFNVGATNDYVWRGVSQSNEDPALQVGADLTSGMYYAGTWASNVDFGSGTDYEWDVYAGIRPTAGPVTFDLGVIAYLYPGTSDLNTFEGKAAATVAGIGGSSYTASFYYSPDVASTGDSSTYTEVSGSWPLPAELGPFSLSLAASAGYYNFQAGTDYWNYRAGLAGTTENGFGFNLGLSDTDLENTPTADPRASLLLTKTF